MQFCGSRETKEVRHRRRTAESGKFGDKRLEIYLIPVCGTAEYDEPKYYFTECADELVAAQRT